MKTTLNTGWVRHISASTLHEGLTPGELLRSGAVPRLPYETRLFQVRPAPILRRQRAGTWGTLGMQIVWRADSGMTQAPTYSEQ